MTIRLLACAVVAGMISTAASASQILVTANGQVRIGINDSGELNVGSTGIGYNFSGQGGRLGFQDALSPGCPCESWGVSANGLGGQVGQNTGNQNISILAPTSAPGSFTSNTALATVPGLTITQKFSISNETATGGLFRAQVTLTNTTGATMTDVRYARAMDWDVPPTEFSEYVTHVGTGTTSTLLRSTDNGFANANPISAVFDTGIVATPNTDGDQGGASDHGSLFVFGLGNLDPGESYTLSIFYGAGANEADALALLGAVSPELYSFGQSNGGSGPAEGLPTFIFAFAGVGGSVVVPPTGVPEPATLGLFGIGLLGLSAVARRRRNRTG